MQREHTHTLSNHWATKNGRYTLLLLFLGCSPSVVQFACCVHPSSTRFVWSFSFGLVPFLSTTIILACPTPTRPYSAQALWLRHRLLCLPGRTRGWLVCRPGRLGPGGPSTSATCVRYISFRGVPFRASWTAVNGIYLKGPCGLVCMYVT